MDSTESQDQPSWLRYLRWEAVSGAPTAIETELRRRVVDTVAAIIAGHAVEGIDISTDYAAETFASGDSTVMDGSGRQRCQTDAPSPTGSPRTP
jgi:hypothetical protein